MAKKNPYVFTIGFDETDPAHVRAAEILNGTKKKAQLIAAAILSYIDGVGPERVVDFNVIHSLLENLVQKEIDKALAKQDPLKGNSEKYNENIVNLALEEDLQISENLTQSIVDAMDVFRRT